MRKFLVFLLSVSLTSLVAVSSVSANHLEEVLGVEEMPVLSIPPTAEGPGFLLPDSPIFFLDQLKQEVRLLLAITPEQKAKVHNAVAGERLAELQIMLAKSNPVGVRIALQGISENLKAAAGDVGSAKLTGRSVSLLAKEINDSIKAKQKSLSVLEKEALGELKAQVMAAKESLKVSKVKVEDNLPPDLLINEMEEDLSMEINDNISKAAHSAVGINRAIDVLTRLASEAAQKNQPRRYEALIHAIEVKNLVSQFQNASTRLQKEAPTPTPTKAMEK